MGKKLCITIIILASFVYGILVGHFKIFPYSFLQSLKSNFIEKYELFVVPEKSFEIGEVEFIDTHLNRLAVKKIKLGSGFGYGGGITMSDNSLLLVSNKGEILMFDASQYNRLNLSVNDVPMNYNALMQSEIPNNKTFRLRTFRVNGIYSEAIDSSTHKLFVSHNGYDAENDCITWNVSSVELKFQTEQEIVGGPWNTIFTAEPCIDPEPENWLTATSAYSGNVAGGRIVEYNNNQILVTVGDYDHHGLSGVPAYAMDESNPYGKLILVDKETGEWNIFTKGSRNPSGLFIDKKRKIWSVENGPRGGDELNIIEEGVSYGWPLVSYGLWYDPEYSIGKYLMGTHPVYRKPVYAWIPSVAPSNMLRVEGERFQLWHGDLLIGTMRDQSLRRLRLVDENRVVYDERIPLGHRVRDMTVLPNEDIGILTDDGYLLIVADAGPISESLNDVTKKRIAELNKWDQIALSSNEGTDMVGVSEGAQLIFNKECASCHYLSDVNQIGPHLNNIFDRNVGGLAGYPYSNVLKKDKRLWTPELMKNFLLYPEREFSGNRMPHIELSEAEVDSLINFLEK